ncbi:transcription factor A, mitochondrial [Aplochiton taeniatus]
MAPFNLMSVGVSLLAKSYGLFSSAQSLARCTSVLPAVKCFGTTVGGPPKRPLNGYMRFVKLQRPIVVQQNPDVKAVDVIRKIAHQWRMLTPEQKWPFEEASVSARQQFKVDLQRYQAQLSPAQIAAQAEERKQRLAKRKAVRKKRELTTLGKPKRPRSAFNIYMSEHFEEARGLTMPAKMTFMVEEWRRLFSSKKQVYMQLAEDDKIRYNNEIKSWEEHMVDIGRQDLLRDKSKVAQKKKKKPPPKKMSMATKKTATGAAGQKAKRKAKTAAKKNTGKSGTTSRTVKKA